MNINTLLVAAVAAALVVPGVLSQITIKPRDPGGNPSVETTPAAVRSGGSEESFGIATAKRDSRGHFSFNALMNGTDVPVLVDTGASGVAINASTAEEIGVWVDEDATGVQVNTANGTTTAYPVTIDEIIIGEVIVTNVSGMVLDDSALSSTLLGMSFLKKLERFEIVGDTLTLSQ